MGEGCHQLQAPRHGYGHHGHSHPPVFRQPNDGSISWSATSAELTLRIPFNLLQFEADKQSIFDSASAIADLALMYINEGRWQPQLGKNSMMSDAREDGIA